MDSVEFLIIIAITPFASIILQRGAWVLLIVHSVGILTWLVATPAQIAQLALVQQERNEVKTPRSLKLNEMLIHAIWRGVLMYLAEMLSPLVLVPQ